MGGCRHIAPLVDSPEGARCASCWTLLYPGLTVRQVQSGGR